MSANRKLLCYTPELHDKRKPNPDWVKAPYIVHHWSPIDGAYTVVDKAIEGTDKAVLWGRDNKKIINHLAIKTLITPKTYTAKELRKLGFKPVGNKQYVIED